MILPTVKHIKIGDRVRAAGYPTVGTVEVMGSEWVSVLWDPNDKHYAHTTEVWRAHLWLEASLPPEAEREVRHVGNH